MVHSRDTHSDRPTDPTPCRVAYQGEAGAYSEAAAMAALGSDIEPIPCETFDEVFEALVEERADRAIVPIENSLAGSIHRNYDLMLRNDLHIVGEYGLRVRHHLMALPGQSLKDVDEVLSHPQALSQCEYYLRELDVRWQTTYDTAGSAKRVRNKQLTAVAAIASRRAAKVYDLEVLAEGIEDDSENYTRFLVLSQQPQTPPEDRAAKTSIVFSLHDEPSVLFKALSVFALRDIDLTKLESRPLRGKRWRYLFYLDFAGNVTEERSQNALRHLREIAPMLRVLGSYPRHEH